MNISKSKTLIPDSSEYASYWMRQALMQAQKAYQAGEVPVGAVIVMNNTRIASAYNKKETSTLATAHAEILAINKACKKLKTWRLSGADIFVTLEPCVMCIGALIQARINTLYIGCTDPKSGACLSNWNLHDQPNLNHRINIISGIYSQESQNLLQSFFQKKRQARHLQADTDNV